MSWTPSTNSIFRGEVAFLLMWTWCGGLIPRCNRLIKITLNGNMNLYMKWSAQKITLKTCLIYYGGTANSGWLGVDIFQVKLISSLNNIVSLDFFHIVISYYNSIEVWETLHHPGGGQITPNVFVLLWYFIWVFGETWSLM